VTRRRAWALRLGSAAVLLAAWEVYGRLRGTLFTSYPTAIGRAAVGLVADGTLLKALSQSMAVYGTGFALAVATGVVAGIVCGRSQTLSVIVEAPLNALNAVPAVALIPLIVLWFGVDLTAKAAVVFLFVVVPVLVNTIRGVQEVDPELLEVARAFGSSELRMWPDLLPSALPYIVTGIRLAIGRGLVGVIAAEFYTSVSGLGFLITSSANSFQTAQMLVSILAVAAIGVALTAALGLLERRLAAWRPAPAPK